MVRDISLDTNKYILIRQAAIELFYRQGINNTNMQQIANEAGIAKGTIYLYYKNRDDLVAYVLEHCIKLNIEASMEGVESQDSSSEKLKKRIKNILFWSVKYPQESSIIRPYYQPVNIVGTESVFFTKSYDINKMFLKEGIDNGEFKGLSLDFLSTMFFSSVEGISTYIIKNPQILEDEELLDVMLETIVAGIKN